jgi:hypothetical protein
MLYPLSYGGGPRGRFGGGIRTGRTPSGEACANRLIEADTLARLPTRSRAAA